jgi:CheY-like chemotaxis protein
LSTQSFDVGAVLTNLGEILRSALGPGIRVQLDIADNLPMLVADKTQLETVLLNLTGNARDAMPGGGTLTLSACLDRAGAAGSAIRLSVTDTGIGMDADTLQRAPEPFFTTKPKGQGTGLGLSMAKGFAEQSGGALSVVSVAGAGTTVTMWFPAGPEPDRVEERFAIADADRAASHAPLILLIDDEVLILDLLAEQLVGRGYRVMCADGARPALEFLASGVVPAVIISDLSMPEMDGLTLLNEIHSRYPSIPTILLTGFAGDAAALAPASALTRTFRLLRKPVSGAQLAKMVARVLEAGSGEAGSAQAGPAQAGPAQAGRAAEFVVPVARE